MSELTNETYDTLRTFALNEMGGSDLGRRWLDRLQLHGSELLTLFNANDKVRNMAGDAMSYVAALLSSEKGVLDEKGMALLSEMLEALDAAGGEELQGFVADARTHLREAQGQPVRSALDIRR